MLFRNTKNLKATIFGLIVWAVLGPIVLPVFSIFYLYSRFVHLLAKLFHPELIPISKCDALLTVAPSNAPLSLVYTCQILRVRGLLDVDVFRNHFYQCFLSTEEDRQKYKNLYCYFVEYFKYIFKKPVKQIDLQWHIHTHHLNEGESLEKFVGKWMVTHDSGISGSLSEQETRPSWMIKIIPDKIKNETIVIFKLHHGLCDGYTIVHLLDKLCSQHSPYLFKEPLPSCSEIFLKILQCPYHIYNLCQKMSKLRKGKMNLVENATKNEKKEWLISMTSLDLESLKFIRRITVTKFVSVLMSIHVGALKRFLKEVEPNACILKNIAGEVAIGHSMGWPEHPVPMNGGGMTNHLTMGLIMASFHLDDPVERLQHLDQNYLQMISKGYPVVGYYLILNFMKYLPACLTRAGIVGPLSMLTGESALSSLSGSAKQHFLLGHQVENVWLPVITPLFPNLKLMTNSFTHSGMLEISINARASLVKNQAALDKLVKVHLKQELESLRIKCQELANCVVKCETIINV